MKLDSLWRMASAASSVAELARQSQQYQFQVEGAVTLYLQAQQSAVRLSRHDEPQITVQVQLQPAFGWRIATDQDENGVYVVAARRPLIGSLASALFTVTLPPATHVILRLSGGQVTLEGVDGTVEIAPSADGWTVQPK